MCPGTGVGSAPKSVSAISALGAPGHATGSSQPTSRRSTALAYAALGLAMLRERVGAETVITTKAAGMIAAGGPHRTASRGRRGSRRPGGSLVKPHCLGPGGDHRRLGDKQAPWKRSSPTAPMRPGRAVAFTAARDIPPGVRREPADDRKHTRPQGAAGHPGRPPPTRGLRPVAGWELAKEVEPLVSNSDRSRRSDRGGGAPPVSALCNAGRYRVCEPRRSSRLPPTMPGLDGGQRKRSVERS